MESGAEEEQPQLVSIVCSTRFSETAIFGFEDRWVFGDNHVRSATIIGAAYITLIAVHRPGRVLCDHRTRAFPRTEASPLLEGFRQACKNARVGCGCLWIAEDCGVRFIGSISSFEPERENGNFGNFWCLQGTVCRYCLLRSAAYHATPPLKCLSVPEHGGKKHRQLGITFRLRTACEDRSQGLALP